MSLSNCVNVAPIRMVQTTADHMPLEQPRDAGNDVLFKMRNDPRVTPVGRVMRKFSLDELPQVFNVIGGSMSIVGPRPPLPGEVEQYADHVHRRFLTKPGITGAWQAGGRSTLSWEDSRRLDLGLRRELVIDRRHRDTRKDCQGGTGGAGEGPLNSAIRVEPRIGPGSNAEFAGGVPPAVHGRHRALPALPARPAPATVAVTSTDELPPDKVKQISWGLEAGKQHLVLAPSIVDIAGPRIHMRPVAGLPLIHVETPRFSRGQRVTKRAMDVLCAGLGVVLISPILAFLAMSIRLSSEGPVFFRQTRVGLGGKEFSMIKFRSMVTNAEELLAELEKENRDAGNEVLFKMKNDPRVTPIGRIMRKFSLDELPQLFNVLGGSMSLVGPRPPLPKEVALYATHVHRRFLVKPGITGLWQVSGRSSLSWEDSVRLDLSYVENWSLVQDAVILAKTAKAALAPGETAH